MKESGVIYSETDLAKIFVINIYDKWRKKNFFTAWKIFNSKLFVAHRNNRSNVFYIKVVLEKFIKFEQKKCDWSLLRTK